MKRFAALLGLALLSFATPPSKKTKVWLVGDSTCANKEIRAYPETGWGMPFTYFFDSTITVDNRAKNGRSTKSFRAEGLWAPILESLSEGDFVFIQFGHNDEGKEKVGRFTTPEEFRANLLQYVTEARAKKAIPILLTPVARRTFDAAGNVVESHPVYADVVRQVAQSGGVALIDIDARSMTLLQEFGSNFSSLLYNHLAPGEHPNYPEGRKDDTHFNELGARKIAELVLSGIRNLKLGLADHLAKPPVKQ
jgi:lysophospholipase L1-like esterase